LRDSLDQVRDKFGQLALKLGGELAPAISDVADSLSDLVDTADAVKVPELLKFGAENTALNRLRQFFELFSDGEKTLETFETSQARGIDGTRRLAFEQESANRTIDEGNDSFSQYVDNLENVAAADEAAARQAEKHAAILEEQRDVTDELREAEERRLDVVNRSLGGSLRLSQAQRDARDSLWKYNETVKEHNEAADEFKLNQDQMNDLIEETALDQIDAARATADYRIEQAEASGATVASTDANRILIEELFKLAGTLDGPVQAAVIRAIEELDRLSQPRTIPLNVHVTQSGANIANLPGQFNTGGGLRAAFGAEGAIVNRPTMALIGEAGPEALVPLNRTPGNSPLPGGIGAGGNQYTINLYGGEATPQAVVDAIKKWERLNGTAWRS
jgi:hypothetical protein